MQMSSSLFTKRGVSPLRADVLSITLVIHILGLALPLTLLQIYDRILPGQSFGTTTVLVVGVAIAILLDAFLRYGRAKLFIDAGAKYEAQMLVGFFDRLLKADLRQVEEKGADHITNTARSISKVKDLFSGQTITALYEVPFVFVYIALIAYIAGWLAWIPTILFLVTLLMTLGLSRTVSSSEESAVSLEADRSKLSWSIGMGMNYFKSMAAESDIARKFSSVNQKYLSSNSKHEAQTAFLNENSSLVSQLSTVLIVVFGAQEVISGNMTTGALAAATLLSGRSIAPCMAGISLITRLGHLRREMREIDAFAKLPSTINHKAAEPSVSLGEQVSLTLSGKLIPDGHFDITSGTVLHVTGDDSCQVSHLLADIAALSNRTATKIEANGSPLEDISRQAYRKRVMYVPRTTTLLPGSILNNLTLYDPRYNANARLYADKMGLSPVLDKMKNGILTEVGQASNDVLDQGIYQRIAIIRALVREPSVLILDNAASGLDMDGLKRLAAVIEELKGKTTVIVASSKPQLIHACTDKLALAEVR